MKNKIVFALAALLCCAGISQAQTTTNSPATNAPTVAGITGSSILQEVWDDAIASTNAAFVGGAGRGLTGNKKLLFVDYLYNMTQNPNNNACLLLGYDRLWQQKFNEGDANVVRGGLNLNAKLYPFKNFGATNFYTTPNVFNLLATPTSGTSNNGGIGNIVGGGIDFKWVLTKNLDIHVGGLYENRTGEGKYDGNYLGMDGALSWKF